MTLKRRAFVCGAGGFIGGHLVKRLKAEGYWVRGVDLKEHEFSRLRQTILSSVDLRDPVLCVRSSTRAWTRSTNLPPTWVGPVSFLSATTTRRSCTTRR